MARKYFTSIELANQSSVKFFEKVAGGSNFVALEAPDALAGDLTFKLPATDGAINQVLKTDGSGNLGWASQGGSGGGINYISNSGFGETANGVQPTGWVRYLDSGAVPTDGTGGSPDASFTFLASTSSSLRGLVSAVLTKDAANRQGHGVSYDFTIDSRDADGAPLQVQFDKSNSAAFVSGDMVVYLYDVTNSVLITPSVTSVASGTGTFTAWFLTTTSTSYRLILHVATVNASAWTVKLDTVSVGPQQSVQGVGAQEGSFSSPVTGVFTDNTATILYSWIGKTVTMTFSGSVKTGDTTGPAAITISLANMPSTIPRPAQDTWFPVMVSNAAATATGILKVPVSGNISVYKDASLNNFTSQSTVCGVYSFTVSYESAFTTSNVTLANRAVESYASKTLGGSISWGTTDTTTTQNYTGVDGAQGGSTTPAGAGGFSFSVFFNDTIQSTDKLFLEISIDRKLWVDPGSNWSLTGAIDRFRGDGTNNIGAGLYAFASGTNEAKVAFGKYCTGTNAAWNGVWYWRVRKVASGASVGFPVSARNIIGDTSGTAVPAGLVGEAVGTLQSGTGGFSNNTPFTGGGSWTGGTPVTIGTKTLNKGSYLLCCNGSASPNSAVASVDIQLFIGGTNVTPNYFYTAGYVGPFSLNLVQPITITADNTAVDIKGRVTGGNFTVSVYGGFSIVRIA